MAVFSGHNIDCVRGERQVLSGATFSLESGAALVLRGANGSGKSTLLRLMAGLMRPVAGAITWDGEDIADDPHEHNRRIAYIGHADAVKPALSVTENVSFWSELSGAGGMRATEALTALGIGHLADLPARYLSAGQRRRVTLTRMLTSGAPLWLLDEPTTALDQDTSDALRGLIDRHLASGGMAVISTHTDLGLASSGLLTLGAAS
ncbi:MAG: heme ABC exporter ATP-binding protein CcmA [Rhodospirillales bacterium]|nr:heme ABC exporter ATP-binding protein CcmA [Rhodospirillales bacterium]MBO6788180.1 heme ABC exporter ATP-binding protein CcmA [Rhodospirillales bacterium]